MLAFAPFGAVAQLSKLARHTNANTQIPADLIPKFIKSIEELGYQTLSIPVLQKLAIQKIKHAVLPKVRPMPRIALARWNRRGGISGAVVNESVSGLI